MLLQENRKRMINNCVKQKSHLMIIRFLRNLVQCHFYILVYTYDTGYGMYGTVLYVQIVQYVQYVRNVLHGMHSMHRYAQYVQYVRTYVRMYVRT